MRARGPLLVAYRAALISFNGIAVIAEWQIWDLIVRAAALRDV